MDNFFIFGAKYLFIISLLIFTYWFWKENESGKKILFWYSLISAVLTLLAGKISSLIYFNPRPFVENDFVPLINHAPDNGFPSDHMLLVAALASIVSFYNKTLGILLWLLASLVGISRVYVGVHSFLDIAASTILAIIATYLVYVLINKK